MSPLSPRPAGHYQHFDVAVYARVYEVRQMSDIHWLSERFDALSRQVKINKVYLETHRDWIVAEESTLIQAKRFLEERGVRVSGGITITVNEMNRFQTYCYTNPEHRQKLKEVVSLTARLFDEVILDDFFFTNCKCPSCIQAKGEKSWTDFRLGLMSEAAESLVLAPARAANPNVRVIIKYPNWYEHFQGLGFDLEAGPKQFDAIYTGTETRDAVVGTQHFQPYHGYSILRYFEAIKPGGNAGGWVDTGGARTLDRYAEQIWLTLFAKAREVTLFDLRQMQRPLRDFERAPWQGRGASLDYDRVVAPLRQADGSLQANATIAAAAGAAFELADSFLGELGEPLGVACYRPYHATGEDFLHSYLGMLGIPIALGAEFPSQAHTILLTESAQADAQIVAEIQAHLMAGKNIVITSALLNALQDRGIRDIAELEVLPRRMTVNQFLIGWNRVYPAARPVTVSQIHYLTNDSWEEISCLSGVTGTPLLHSARYAGGVLYVLNVPDDFADLYSLPAGVLNRIRETLAHDLWARLEGPAQVALFLYDNRTLIVESFLDEDAAVHLVVDNNTTRFADLLSGEELVDGLEIMDWFGRPSGKKAFPLVIRPHAFRVLRGYFD